MSQNTSRTVATGGRLPYFEKQVNGHKLAELRAKYDKAHTKCPRTFDELVEKAQDANLNPLELAKLAGMSASRYRELYNEYIGPVFGLSANERRMERRRLRSTESRERNERSTRSSSSSTGDAFRHQSVAM